MKIAQVAPLAESCPPKLYGGTERIVSYLTEELVRLGHNVTLSASGDSITTSKLVQCSNTALRLDPLVRDMTPYHVMMLDEVYRRLDDFDVLHFHIDQLHYPLMRAFSDRIAASSASRMAPSPGLDPPPSTSAAFCASDRSEGSNGLRGSKGTVL